MTLTKQQFDNAQTSALKVSKREWITDPRDTGLLLCLQPHGRHEWQWRRTLDDKRRVRVRLGFLADYNTDEARDKLKREMGMASDTEKHFAKSPAAAINRAMTASKLAEHWFENVAPGEYQKDTVSQARTIVRNFFLERRNEQRGRQWGEILVSQLERHEILLHFDALKLLKNPKTGKPYAHSVYACKRWLSKILLWAVDRGRLIEASPMPDAKSMRLLPRKARTDYLDATELHQIQVELAESSEAALPLHVLAIRLSLLTGIRQREITRTLWKEVEGDLWRLTKNKMDHDGVTIPILPPLRAVLDELKKWTGETNYLFPSEGARNLPVDVKHLSHVVADFCNARPQMPKFTTHKLRRTLETSMLELGITSDLAHFCTGHRAKQGAKRSYQHEKLHYAMPTAFARYYAYLDVCASGKGEAFLKELEAVRAASDPMHVKAMELHAKFAGRSGKNVADLATARAKRQ